MLFHIKRTSIGCDEEVSPCEAAVQMSYISHDRRLVDDPKKNRYLSDWYLSGANHRVEHGNIVRDFGKVGWFIDLSTLEEALTLARRYSGRLVLSVENNSDYPSIEIYDGYRE